MAILLEKWNDLIVAEGPKLKPVQDADTMAQVLENQEEYSLKEEQSNTSDMAPFFPILVPATRRIFPGLLANDIVGVQPLNGPTGYAYAIRFRYGDGAGPVSGPSANPRDYLDYYNNGAAVDGTDASLQRGDSFGGPRFRSWGLVLANEGFDGAGAAGATAQVYFYAADGVTLGSEGGTVTYGEPGRVLVTLDADFIFGSSQLPISGGKAEVGGVDVDMYLALGNEAGFNLIFRNYAAKVTTSRGEQLGQGYGDTYQQRIDEIKTMKMSLERVATEAMTRKLKAEYSMELAQDLKNVHGLDAEQELINIIEYEVAAEIDRELVDKINALAVPSVRPWVYALSTSNIAAGSNVSDGRWEQEKFRTLYTRIVKEANTIALTTRRGSGNFIICSTNVATALETLSSFMYSAVPGTVTAGTGVSKVGVLDGRFTVYVDTFAMIDYVTVGYKGPGAFDTGLVYCPYVPLMVQKVVDPNSFQPKIGFMTRYALVENLFGAENYYRRFLVDFAGSSLAGPSLW
jgi:hypothetical protein